MYREVEEAYIAKEEVYIGRCRLKYVYVNGGAFDVCGCGGQRAAVGGEERHLRRMGRATIGHAAVETAIKERVEPACRTCIEFSECLLYAVGDGRVYLAGRPFAAQLATSAVAGDKSPLSLPKSLVIA